MHEAWLESSATPLRAELDYAREAANVMFFREAFKNELGIKVPDVIAVISRRIVRFVLEPAFERGVFHADPHPGNLLLQEDDTLCVLDFGKVGRLTPEQRRRVADIFIAIGRSDAQRLTDRLIEITTPMHPIDRALVTAEIDRMLQQYANAALSNVHIGDALGDLLQLGRRYRLRLPGNLVQFFKTLAMAEGLLLKIHPESSFADYLRPMAGKLVLQGFVGRPGADHLRDSALDLAENASDLPRRLDRILADIERGNLRVWTRIEDLDTLLKRADQVAARTNATILVAACIMGLAMVIPYYHPQGWDAWIGIVFWLAVTAVVAGSIRTLLRLRK